MPTVDLTAASRLCTACGMCCNGVLFHIVRLQPGDSIKTLERLGLKVSRKKKKPYFHQPCQALQGCHCTIYQDRPTRCRLFECRQIQELNGGGISESKAATVIVETKASVNRVEGLLAEWGNKESQRPLLERCQQVIAIHPAAQKSELTEEMYRLNELLNRHFRLVSVQISF